MNRQVTIYTFPGPDGTRAEVRRHHSEVLHATGHHESADAAVREAGRWMAENDFVLGGYRVGWRAGAVAADPEPAAVAQDRPRVAHALNSGR